MSDKKKKAKAKSLEPGEFTRGDGSTATAWAVCIKEFPLAIGYGEADVFAAADALLEAADGPWVNITDRARIRKNGRVAEVKHYGYCSLGPWQREDDDTTDSAILGYRAALKAHGIGSGK